MALRYIGVPTGDFANITLSQWPIYIASCKHYVYSLVDVWATLENYVDIANKGQAIQDVDQLYAKTMKAMEPYKKRELILMCAVIMISRPIAIAHAYACPNSKTNPLKLDYRTYYIYMSTLDTTTNLNMKGVLQDLEL